MSTPTNLDLPPTSDRSWSWMAGSLCQDCGRERGSSRGWLDARDLDDDSCQEQGHTVLCWDGPDANVDKATAAAIERWWQRYAYTEEVATLVAVGTPEAIATARWYARQINKLTTEMPNELTYRVQVTVPHRP